MQTLRFPIAAITDEFSTDDLDAALDAMQSVGMTGAELRLVYGRNVVDLTDAELDRARAAVESRGMRVLSIASPVLKCVLPNGPDIDARFQQDVFGSAYTYEDQPRLSARALEVAARTGAPIIRVFSGGRTVAPDTLTDTIAAELRRLADRAQAQGAVIGLENEHACNVGTGAEAGRMMAAVDHPALGVIWDPANASILGEEAFPDGYSALPLHRVVHVHAKDCMVAGHTPTWGPLGEMAIDWAGQIGALSRDGYGGAISLETHWRGPDGNRLEASTICGRSLRDLVASRR